MYTTLKEEIMLILLNFFDAKYIFLYFKHQLIETKLSIGKKVFFETFSLLYLEAYTLYYREGRN